MTGQPHVCKVSLSPGQGGGPGLVWERREGELAGRGAWGSGEESGERNGRGREGLARRGRQTLRVRGRATGRRDVQEVEGKSLEKEIKIIW